MGFSRDDSRARPFCSALNTLQSAGCGHRLNLCARCAITSGEKLGDNERWFRYFFITGKPVVKMANSFSRNCSAFNHWRGAPVIPRAGHSFRTLLPPDARALRSVSSQPSSCIMYVHVLLHRIAAQLVNASKTGEKKSPPRTYSLIWSYTVCTFGVNECNHPILGNFLRWLRHQRHVLCSEH